MHVSWRWWIRAGAVLAMLAAAPAVSPVDAAAPRVTHGVASGDVTSDSAVVWARASGPGTMHVAYDTHPLFLNPRRAAPAAVSSSTDFTAAVLLQGLRPDTRYYYQVWFEDEDRTGLPVLGSFETAPAPAASRPVGFVVGGDVGGQRHCRREGLGYRIFTSIRGLDPDFLIANGDFIYADGDCPAEGPDGPGGWENVPGGFPSIADARVYWTDLARVREVYLDHWRYNRADEHFQRLLQTTPVYAQWDDHEVINDFGAPWSSWNAENLDRPGFPNLVTAGRDAFLHWWPIARDPSDRDRIYRAFRWGQEMDLFIVDARSYRSRNDLPDTPENAKTLLGPEQLAWLKEGLADSQATWKVVSSDVPLSAPTGSNAAAFGRDAWANGTQDDFSAETGFERELMDLITFLDEQDVQNVVFVTTDVHFAATLRYEVDADGDGEALVFHELVSGPLNAVRGEVPEFDPTLNPTVLYSEGQLFNFSYVRIDRAADGTFHLVADVRGEDGRPRPGSRVELAPR
ncbi:alkaline phosphatase D family protein [Limnochorda pilosa]|uniref:Alkaline phosphatase n=1 Tax=Limnochorda pilosa TaxID=1555112 RepID=A0A0K2SHZ1_LIMPI|nr:alkaline phosphatase D family protein [Limnochorda pilosa]BAS26695.1 alkaline phosphatase [Limnochorda pilosa]